jgi:hypothetical protein
MTRICLYFNKLINVFAIATSVNLQAASAGMTILKVEKKQSAGVGIRLHGSDARGSGFRFIEAESL